METAREGMGHPIVNIIADKVALGPLRRDLVPLYVRWVNDFEVWRAVPRALAPMTLEAEEAWYERMSKSEHEAAFTVYERTTMRPIGTTSLHNIDHFNRRAVFGIMIGEKDCWGKGYGTEVARLMLDYGFHGLRLHSVFLRVYSFNERAIRAYTRAGFRPAGRLRESIRRGDHAYDEIYMDCLATEFEGTVPSLRY